MKSIFKMLSVAAALALPSMASAVTLNTGYNTIVVDESYFYTETAITGGGSRQFVLDASPATLALRGEFNTLEFNGLFQGLSVTLTTLMGTTAAVLTPGVGNSQVANLDTIFDSVNGLVQTLDIVWTGVTGTGAGIQIQANTSAVPVPAGGLLLVSALGGIAALRRRKSAQA